MEFRGSIFNDTDKLQKDFDIFYKNNLEKFNSFKIQKKKNTLKMSFSFNLIKVVSLLFYEKGI